MQLDTYTLQLTTSLMVGACLIVIGALRLTQHEKAAANFWLLSYIFVGPGFLALGLRPQLPAYAETVGNMAIVIGLLLLNRGLRVFLGIAQRFKLEVALFVVYFLPFLAYTYLWPSYSMRTTIVNFVLVQICFDIVYTLHRCIDPGYKTAGYSVAVVFAILGLALVSNQVDVFSNFADYSPQDLGPLFLMNTFVLGGITMTLTFLSYAKLSSNYRLFASAVNQSSSSIVITDPVGKITYANSGFQEKSGKDLRSLVADDRPCKFGDMNEDEYNLLWKTVNSGQTWRGEVRTHLPDGTCRWEVTTISPIRLRNDKVSHLVAVQEDISALKEAEAKIRHLAYHDALTNLPTLRLAQDRLEAACSAATRTNSIVAVMFIDLDGFKLINDTYGHDCGDLLLVELARRMLGCVRESDTVARIGGDEFLMVLNQCTLQQDVERVATRVISEVSKPVRLLSGETVAVGCSIGVAFYPTHGRSMDAILRCADRAMYVVKQSGKNNYRIAA